MERPNFTLCRTHDTDENLIGDYVFKIYSEYGSSESVSTFSIVKSSMPMIVTRNTVEELVTNSTATTELQLKNQIKFLLGHISYISIFLSHSKISSQIFCIP